MRCKAVPFVELTVAHASVLTILAISFERYYAICEPLRAGYVCTKARALLICLLAWALAALLTSPMLAISQFAYHQYADGSLVPTCLSEAAALWQKLFFTVSSATFFAVPVAVLLALYGKIARHLMAAPGAAAAPPEAGGNARARRQVVLMLATVVLSFFLCLLPFRAFTLWIVFASSASVRALGIEAYYSLLYFCRTMFYLNSAVNPILYSLMSSKFRAGFARLFGYRERVPVTLRRGTTDDIFAVYSPSRRTNFNGQGKCCAHTGSWDGRVRSPVTALSSYELAEYTDGSVVAICLTEAATFWAAAFFVAAISLFFLLPLVVLVALYSVIARHLMEAPDIVHHHQHNHYRYRKQVVLMLGTVVVSFFVCLLPFRALTLWIIVAPPEALMSLGMEGYYNLLYFCRTMHYLNSAVNPILYNLMSSKFRNGFARLCCGRRRSRRAGGSEPLGRKAAWPAFLGRDSRLEGRRARPRSGGLPAPRCSRGVDAWAEGRGSFRERDSAAATPTGSSLKV
ncbi:orexin receptor type 2-like [Schistocerca serialis cubense]|uniref:orexin receptor type 2-like n=1 Tax=Schistocerca serialis cubense TaxID=2023355 RepID=UPI00214E561B|nr:orexin receptor type 2-like [Schistocerca serialis cubense]